MNSTVNGPSSSSQSMQHLVMLPCSPDQFNQFIGGLLGKPQTISQDMYGSFEIDKAGIENIHLLLNQRIEQQNGGHLMQFTARMIFDDASSVLLNNIDDLMSYNEVRPVVCKQVHLSWSYLIQFNGKKFPEKQSIDISFVADQKLLFLNEAEFISSLINRPSVSVTFRIQHTARTWGSDIQSLLDNHLTGLLTFEGGVKKFVRKYHTTSQFLVFISFLLTAFYRIYFSALDLMQTRLANVDALVNKNIATDAKLNGLILAVHTDPWQRFLLSSIGYIIFSIVAAIILGVWMETLSNAKKPSFIILTPMSEKDRTKILQRYNGKWLSFGISVVTSIVTGVIACIIYENYWNT